MNSKLFLVHCYEDKVLPLFGNETFFSSNRPIVLEMKPTKHDDFKNVSLVPKSARKHVYLKIVHF